MNAQWVVDFFKLGIEHSNLNELRCIVFLEGSGDDQPDLTELLKQAQATAEQPLRDPKDLPHDGRVRVPEPTPEETNDQADTIDESMHRLLLRISPLHNLVLRLSSKA
jgi:hypothetical protein